MQDDIASLWGEQRHCASGLDVENAALPGELREPASK